MRLFIPYFLIAALSLPGPGFAAGHAAVYIDATPRTPSADFSLPGSHGRHIQLSHYKGQWVIVNFWATWCGPCIQEIAELRAFHKAHKDQDAMVIGVNFEHIELPKLRAFLKRHAVDYPIARVGEAPLVPFEPLKGLPSTFIVNPQGKLVYRHTGPIDKTQLEHLLRSLKNTET